MKVLQALALWAIAVPASCAIVCKTIYDSNVNWEESVDGEPVTGDFSYASNFLTAPAGKYLEIPVEDEDAVFVVAKLNNPLSCKVSLVDEDDAVVDHSISSSAHASNWQDQTFWPFKKTSVKAVRFHGLGSTCSVQYAEICHITASPPATVTVRHSPISISVRTTTSSVYTSTVRIQEYVTITAPATSSAMDVAYTSTYEYLTTHYLTTASEAHLLSETESLTVVLPNQTSTKYKTATSTWSRSLVQTSMVFLSTSSMIPVAFKSVPTLTLTTTVPTFTTVTSVTEWL